MDNRQRDQRERRVALLFDLMRLPGLAGHEQQVATFMTEQMRPLADEVREDRLGNVIATVEGTDPDAPRVMLFAHMDSLGFIVRKIESDGFIRMHRLGGIPEKVLPALRVQVGTSDGGAVSGVIAVKAHHVTPPEEKTRVTPLAELFLDIGASSAGEVVEMGVQVGAPVTYTGHAEWLGGHRISGTAVDNRSGCLVILETLRQLRSNRPAATVHVVATVQEEFNLRGAAPVAYQIEPDLAICVDGGGAADTPDLHGLSDITLGGGPVMSLYNFHGRGTLNGLMPHPSLVRLMTATAEDNDLPLQRSAGFGGLTDAAYVQLVRDGIACIDLGTARRYTHTPIETTDLRDIDGLIELLGIAIGNIDASFDFRRDPARGEATDAARSA
ncbi:MAG: M42 family metallopeptidase [Trueperaceae bacterium]